MSFNSDLIVKSYKTYKWKLHEPFVFYFDDKIIKKKIKVPKGFVTDFASVPRFLWSIIPPIGRYTKAAVLHDYLYVNPKLVKNKKEADKIFLQAMRVLGVKKTRRYTMYYMVRLFGKGKF